MAKVVGVAGVEVEGLAGFVDQVKHLSWWDREVTRLQVRDETHAVVLNADREPPGLSALHQDSDSARCLRASKGRPPPSPLQDQRPRIPRKLRASSNQWGDDAGVRLP